MDGVFMKRLCKIIVVLSVLCLLFTAVMLSADRQKLQNDVLRLHIVANSDSETDQTRKLMVRDAVIAYLQPILKGVTEKEEAMAVITEELPKLEAVASGALQANDALQTATVSLCREEFNTRTYDTFRLPAGMYDALRIEIGDAEGRNWWCVVFPSLCVPATTGGFQDVAVSAGFGEGLSNTLSGESGYEIRFFLLDCLGKLENLFHRG